VWIISVIVRMAGWVVMAMGFGAMASGQIVGGLAIGAAGYGLVHVGRQLNYERLATRYDRWAKQDVEIERRRRLP